MGKSIRFRFSRGKETRFLSQLDLYRTMERAIRRSGLPIAFSGGFNPRPQMSFGSALPVGILSKAEYADFHFLEDIAGHEFRARFNLHLPAGLLVLQAQSMGADAPALMSIINAAEYELLVPGINFREIQGRIEWLLARESFVVKRKTKKGDRKINVRPLLLEIKQVHAVFGGIVFKCRCSSGQKGNLQMAELGQMLKFDHLKAQITRTALLIKKGDQFRQPLEN